MTPSDITPEEARQRIERELAQASERVASLLARLSEGLARYGEAESTDSALLAQLIALLAGERPSPAADTPRLSSSELAEHLTALVSVFEAMQHEEPTERVTAQRRLEQVRRALSAHGITLDERFDRLPDLAQLLTTLEQGADAFGQGPEGSIDFEALAASLERDYGNWLGLAAQRQQQEAARQQEYREIARNSIANSLRKHGFTPSSSEPSTD